MQKNFGTSKKVAILALGLLFVLPACWKSEKSSSGAQEVSDGSPAMLTVNGKVLITEKSFQDTYNTLVETNQDPQVKMLLQLLPNAKEELFKGKINEKLLLYWAQAEGVTERPEYQEKFEQGLEVLRVGLAAEFLKKEFSAEDTEISEDDARAWYAAHKDQMYTMAPAKDGKAAQYYPFEQVRQHVEQQMMGERLGRLFVQKLGELKDKYNVVENAASLKPVSAAEEAQAEEQVAQILAEQAHDADVDATDIPQATDDMMPSGDNAMQM